MIKELYDRLSYALIGCVLGAILAVILWFLYDKGFSIRVRGPQLHMDLQSWIKYCGGGFAILGFLFKDNVGTLLGFSGAEVYRHEAYRVPVGEVLFGLAIIAVAAGLWYYFR
ncbi:MAG: hypothetical protein V4805_04490 [Pseudomonadota bacterium]